MVLRDGYPSAIRRQAAFSEAMYDGSSQVEGMVCVHVKDFQEAEEMMARGYVAMLEDASCQVLKESDPGAGRCYFGEAESGNLIGRWQIRPLLWDRIFRRPGCGSGN